MIPWFEPSFSDAELKRIGRVFDSGFINEGPVTREFEQRVAALAGRRYGIAVPNGTTAIALALMAVGLEYGDQVVVPDFTFVATANAVKLAGGYVVLADVDPDNFCLTAESIWKAATNSTRFAVVVEVNGRRPDPSVYQWCNDAGLTVITDSCESLGSADCGSRGLASCFSFSPNKLVTTGQGGMVVTDDDTICERLHQLKYQGLSSRGTGGRDWHPSLGFNFKFNDILAAVGLAQLDRLPDRLMRCRRRDQWYRDAFGEEWHFPKTAAEETCLWTDMLTPKSRDLEAVLKSHDIGCRRFWLPVHEQKSYKRNRKFPVTETISANGVWLPSGYDITQEQVEHVVRMVKEEQCEAA